MCLYNTLNLKNNKAILGIMQDVSALHSDSVAYGVFQIETRKRAFSEMRKLFFIYDYTATKWQNGKNSVVYISISDIIIMII